MACQDLHSKCAYCKYLIRLEHRSQTNERENDVLPVGMEMYCIDLFSCLKYSLSAKQTNGPA